MRDRVLQMLQEKNEFISGQELCENLAVSRTAIWKSIHVLQEEGYHIEAVRNKGYRLISSPDVLFSNEIKSHLQTKWFGDKIIYLESVDSTNNEVKRRVETGELENLLVVSEEQIAGKGRRGRSWKSPRGTGIWMSFVIKPELEPESAPMITLVAAMACAKAIREITGLEASIKWPNDIVVNGKKVVGILTEMSTEMMYVNYVVVGVGINVNMEEFPEEIKEVATSLKIEAKSEISRSQLVAKFGEQFEKYYQEFLDKQNLSSIREEYEEYLINCNKEVAIQQGQDRWNGIALGINNNGELLVKKQDGEVQVIRAGEVSVRGLYGYV